MLRTGFVLFAALAALQAHAERTLELVENSFELRLANTSLPAGGVGDVSFKTCDKCSPLSRVLTPSTQFFVGSQPVTAANFMTAADEIRKTESTNPRSMIVLHVDLKTQNVNRASLVRAHR
jgi:formylglycine-generating enzyme required for sulfatase activity